MKIQKFAYKDHKGNHIDIKKTKSDLVYDKMCKALSEVLRTSVELAEEEIKGPGYDEYNSGYDKWEDAFTDYTTAAIRALEDNKAYFIRLQKGVWPNKLLSQMSFKEDGLGILRMIP